MKKLILIGLLFFGITSCLRHDVIKQDAEGNFKDTEFYKSGDFEGDFLIDISNIIITTTTIQNIELCKPTFNITLNPDFVSQLEREWNGTYNLIVLDSKFLSTPVTYTSTDLRESFEVGLSSLGCSLPHDFKVTLELLSPFSTVQASVEKNFQIIP